MYTRENGAVRVSSDLILRTSAFLDQLDPRPAVDWQKIPAGTPKSAQRAGTEGRKESTIRVETQRSSPHLRLHYDRWPCFCDNSTEDDRTENDRTLLFFFDKQHFKTIRYKIRCKIR